MSKYSEAGKGSAPRKNADSKLYGENHSKVFGRSGWLERKKQEEAERAQQALDKLIEVSEELNPYS